MLQLKLGEYQTYDEDLNKFVMAEPSRIILMEHSLYSMALWEEKYTRPFPTGDDSMSAFEYLDYINMMCLNATIEKDELTDENVATITEYINTPHTATRINSKNESSASKIITTEQIYASMTIGRVDWSAQYWNINRLMTLLEVVADMQSDKKKMSKQEIYEQNRRLNEERRRAMGSKG